MCFTRLFLLLIASLCGFSADVDLGMGPPPAGASIYTGGTVPTATRVAVSDGTSLTGYAGFTSDSSGNLTTGSVSSSSATDATSGTAAAVNTLGGVGATKGGWFGTNLTWANGIASGTVTDAATASLTSMLIMAHKSTGTVANSFGSSIAYQAADDGGTLRNMGFLDCYWTTAATASRASTLQVRVITGAAVTTAMTIGPTKITALTGFPFTASDPTAGALTCGAAGGGVSIKSGTNARCGTAILAGTPGTITVSNTSVTANTRVMVTVQAPGGTQGFLSTSKVNSTSFTITSTANETSTVAWELIENP